MSEFSVTGTVTKGPKLERSGDGVPFCGFHLVEDGKEASASNPLRLDVIARGNLATMCAQLIQIESRVKVCGELGLRQMKRGRVEYPAFSAIATSVDPLGARRVEPGMSRVVHCRQDEYDIYIGRGRCPRTNQLGKWGNPYSHRASTVPGVIRVKTVQEAVDLYERWLWKQIKAHRISLEMLAALHGKTFGCWCMGLCHGPVLARAAAWGYQQLASA